MLGGLGRLLGSPLVRSSIAQVRHVRMIRPCLIVIVRSRMTESELS